MFLFVCGLVLFLSCVIGLGFVLLVGGWVDFISLVVG